MNKMMLTIGLAAIFSLVACNSDKTKTVDAKHTETAMTESHVVYYTCPMESHKHIHSMKADTCDDCGMALVPVVKGTDADHEFYGCPMAEHSHVRSDEPGTCAECGMALVPLKFSK